MIAAALGAMAALGVAVWVTLPGPSPERRPAPHGKPAASAGPQAATSPRPASPVAKSAAPDDTRRPSRQWALDDGQLLAVVRRGLHAQAAPLDRYLASQVLWQCQPWLRHAPVGPGESASGVDVRDMHDAQAAMRHRCGALLQIPRSEIEARSAGLDEAWQRPELPFSDQSNTLPRDADAEQLRRFKRILRNNLETGPEALLWAHQALDDWLYHLAAAGQGGPEALRNSPHKETTVLLALCELGYPCDGNSLAYLAVCAATGRCGGTLQAALLADVPAAQRPRTRDDAALLAGILRSNPVAGLGLSD